MLPSLAYLVYVRSVTDSCIDIGVTVEVLGVLAGAVRQRRGQSGTMACWPLYGDEFTLLWLNPM